MIVNRGFANSGRSHNDMLGRFGNMTPPNPTMQAVPRRMGDGSLDQGGMLNGLLGGPQGGSQALAPQGQGEGFFARMRPFLQDRQGMMMNAGAALMSGGFDALPQGMAAGMDYDRQNAESRREQQEEQQNRNATVALLRRYNPNMTDDEAMQHIRAGTASTMLSQALTPAEPGYSVLSPQEAAQMGLPENSRFQRGPNGRITQIGGAGTNVTVNNGGDPVGIEEITKDAVEQSSGIIEAGQQAARSSVQIEELDRLLQTAPQGWAGGVTGLANSMGISVEGGDEAAAAQAILNQMAPQMRPPGSGPMSDADLRLFQASLPRLINQPGGNQIIIEGMRALNQYDQSRGQIAEQYQQNIVNGVTQAQALQQYREQLSQLDASTPSLQTLTQRAGTQPSSSITPPQGIDPNAAQVWEFMTPEQRALFQAGAQ